MNAHVRAWTFFDRPLTQRRLLHVVDGRASTELIVDGMHCGACALRIERALGALGGIERININVATRHAQITWQLARLPFSRILSAIAALGFEPRALGADIDRDKATHEQRTALKRLAVAGFGMMQVMTLAFGLYAGALGSIEAEYEAYLRLVDAETVQQWNSRGHFFAAAAEAMRRILVERARHKRSLKAGGNTGGATCPTSSRPSAARTSICWR